MIAVVFCRQEEVRMSKESPKSATTQGKSVEARQLARYIFISSTIAVPGVPYTPKVMKQVTGSPPRQGKISYSYCFSRSAANNGEHQRECSCYPTVAGVRHHPGRDRKNGGHARVRAREPWGRPNRKWKGDWFILTIRC